MVCLKRALINAPEDYAPKPRGNIDYRKDNALSRAAATIVRSVE
jgi:hypothetical protein